MTGRLRHSVSTERLSEPEPGALRILFITNMWPDAVRPFYGSFIRSQAMSLVDRGIGVDLVYVRGFETVAAYAAALPRIPRIASRGSYDAVHVHYGHTAAASLLIRGLPTVVSFCGEDLLGAPREHGLSRKSRAEVAVFRQVARRATSTITKSTEMERVLPPSVQTRNTVLPNGVDLERFAPRSRTEARERLGWDPNGEVILFLGNPDDPRKNVRLARQAAQRVAERRQQTRLVEAWGVDADNVPTVMNAANCLVFPSLSEGSPNAVKEAMASELPIVANAVGDVQERLSGVAGCTVTLPEPESFANGLLDALGAGRAPAAREAVADLSVAAVAGKLEGIYRAAMTNYRTRQTR